VKHKQLKINSLTKNFPVTIYPTPAWTAILGLIILILIPLLAKVGIIALLVYYLGSFVVGIFLYQRYPILYVGFTWWLWFVGPFVKRLIDYQSGQVMPGAWDLIPALVTSISFATLVRHLVRVNKQGGFPFILGIAAVFYGFLIEIIQQPITLNKITVLLVWLSPILFGFHLFVNWRDYPIYRQNLQRVFLWGVLLLGIYGIWQFFVQPPWDKFWIELDGQCLCFQDRLWSTTYTPFTFGIFMSGGLLLLLINQSVLKIPAAVVGYLSFLLTLSRSAWLSWVFGLLLLFPSLKVRLQQRLIITIMVMVFLCIPLITIEPFSEVIGSRLTTFSNLESDASYLGRVDNYQNNIDYALFEFIGKGLSATIETNEFYSAEDAGILYIILALGWFGAIPFLAGIALLFFKLFYISKNNSDPFFISVRSIAFSIFLLALIGLPGVVAGDGMMLVWGFLGIALAAHKYYLQQNLAGYKYYMVSNSKNKKDTKKII
jgi:hypothetical protein